MGMSNAERQRRYIERLKARAAAVGGAISNDALVDENAALKAEISKLKSRLAELEAVKRRVRGVKR